jgi:sulfide:quinone oxidoreductase
MAGEDETRAGRRGAAPPANVLIAGAGIAGIEAALALRAFAGERATVEMVDPGSRFRIAAAATGRAFGIGSEIDVPLASIVARAGASHRRGAVVAVDPGRHLATIDDGERLSFDRLLVAVGARPRPHLENALTFTGFAEVDAVRTLIDGISADAAGGVSTDLAVIVPPACGWPLAAYELAVMAREYLVAGGHGDRASVTVVTAEDAPLAVFGPVASETVAAKLRRTGVALRTGVVARGWSRGRLDLVGDGALPADRVIALPVLAGPEIGGLPSDAHGFLRTTAAGTVEGCSDVRVIGDAGSFPVKQGGVACQQADAAAAAIARELGADTAPIDAEPVLRGWMWDGEGGRFLRTDLAGGHDESGGTTSPWSLWWPVAKVAGRFLTPFLQNLPRPAALADLPPPKPSP